MVKSPGPKHSKPRKEPVTIDLDAKDVGRGDKDKVQEASSSGSVGSQQAEAKDNTKPAQPSATGGKAGEAAGTSGGQTDTKKAESEKPDREKEKGGSSAGAAKSADRPASGAGAGGVPPSGARAAPSQPPARGGNGIVAGVIGGLVVLVLVAGLQWAGLWPGGATARESAAIAELRQEMTDLRQVLAAETPVTTDEIDARVSAAVSPIQQALQDLEQQIGETADPTGALQGLEERLDEMEARIAALGNGIAPEAAITEVEDQLADITTRLDALESPAEQPEELAARLDGLEQELASIAAELGERADEPRAALVITATALKAAIDRGGSFEAELEAYAALAPDAAGVAELAPHADTGVATRSAILADVSAAADRMAAAGRNDAEPDGFWDGLWQSARGLVTVRPVGMVDGDNAEAIAARLEASIRDGDYERAIAEYEQLPQAAQDAGRDFMDRVRARHQADRLADQALAEALRAS
jgi:hypothetical protein